MACWNNIWYIQIIVLDAQRIIWHAQINFLYAQIIPVAKRFGAKRDLVQFGVGAEQSITNSLNTGLQNHHSQQINNNKRIPFCDEF